MIYRFAAGLLAVVLSLELVGSHLVRAGDTIASDRNIPEAFAPLEYLAGRWKGQGVPKNDPANSFRGWTETHSWAWVFQSGNPVALTVVFEGGHTLATGKLTYDPPRKIYRLEGTLPPPAGGPIQFEGSLNSTGKLLTLQSVGKLTQYSGTIRLSIRPNANFVRYTIREDRKDLGGSQFKPFIEVGVTKEGEAFASAASTAARAKCIITGADSAMAVTYQGVSYPVCCTGCRDEFLDNPEKYIKKASLMQKAESRKPKAAGSAASRVSRLDDAFAGDVAEIEQTSDAKAKPKSRGDSVMKTDTRKANSSASMASPEAATTTKKQATATSAKTTAKAASLLKIGQNLEKNGDNAAALSYYRRVIKEYPDTAAAKTAAERIKALDARSK